MRSLKQIVAVLGGTAIGVLAFAPPSFAASTGSATAVGASVQLNGSIAGVAVVNAQSTVGSVSSPPSSSDTGLSLSSAGGLGTTASGVVTTSATTTASDNEGQAQIVGLNYSLLGAPLLVGGGSAITADANCPTGGTPTASTNLGGLQVLGSSVNLGANASVSESSSVSVLPAVPGLTALTENVTLSNVQQTTANSAVATALVANVSLSATVLGTTSTIPVGTITLASATCNTADNTAPSGATGPVTTPTTSPASPTSPATATTVPAASTTPAGTATTPTTPSTPASSTPSTSKPGGANRVTTARPPAAVPGSLVPNATSVHTGEPWAGSMPYVLAVLGLGTAMILGGFALRRRHRFVRQ